MWLARLNHRGLLHHIQTQYIAHEGVLEKGKIWSREESPKKREKQEQKHCV